MTYNIRYDTDEDGRNKWRNRKDRVIKLIRHHIPDLFGVQEALSGQMNDLQTALYDYDSYGVGRDDAREDGEFCGVFYRCDRFEWREEGTFWLPKKGRIGRKAWRADCPRICSWVKLKDRLTGKEIYHFNTHLDHKIEDARQKSADLILKTIEEKAGSRIPVILTGDFNEEPNSGAYNKIVENTIFNDTQQRTRSPRIDLSYTFCGFNGKNPERREIDYIFITREHFTTETRVRLVDNDGTDQPSDHLPVLATLHYKR
jgi:endonuclease/exonuclease/phosphatase family metal-dependent hydrolase